MKKQSVIGIFAILAIFALFAGIYLGNKKYTPSVAEHPVSQAFFNLQLADSKAQTHKLSEWQNQFLVVNFWATWCAPCVEEMPELNELQQEFKGKDIQILGLAIDSASNVQEFQQKLGVTYPLLLAGVDGSELTRKMGNQAGGLPFTALINKQGKIVKTYLGRLKIKELRADITKFYAEN